MDNVFYSQQKTSNRPQLKIANTGIYQKLSIHKPYNASSQGKGQLTSNL